MRASNGAMAAFGRIDRERARDEARRGKVFDREHAVKASAVDTCVPLSSARPSFACNSIGASPAAARPAAAGSVRRAAGPRRCRAARRRDARAARDRRMRRPNPSPESSAARRRDSSATSASISSRPHAGRAGGEAGNLQRQRQPHDGSSSGDPTPAACDRTRLRCSVARSSAAMRDCASRPKPVLMP